jgi:hypothetical protein
MPFKARYTSTLSCCHVYTHIDFSAFADKCKLSLALKASLSGLVDWSDPGQLIACVNCRLLLVGLTACTVFEPMFRYKMFNDAKFNWHADNTELFLVA